MALIAGAVVLGLFLERGIHQGRLHAAARAFRSTHGPGRDLLLVYTDSPHWQPYIEARWLARWGARAVVLNRSHPWDPRSAEGRLWRLQAGLREHTPAAIVVPAAGRPRFIRLFSAFRDYQHGKEGRLKAAEAELESALVQASGSAV